MTSYTNRFILTDEQRNTTFYTLEQMRERHKRNPRPRRGEQNKGVSMNKETKDYLKGLFREYCGRLPPNKGQLYRNPDFDLESTHILHQLCTALEIYTDGEEDEK